MQTTENTKRQYFTLAKKRKILDELKSSGMTISVLARRHEIHPVTIHKWRREMESNKNNNDQNVDVSDLLSEIKKMKEENNNLKKALADVSVEAQIFKTANEILKKNQRSQKFKSLKKQSKK